jgi:hypothetical protein
MSPGIPLHGRPATVAPYADPRYIFLKGIAHLIWRNGDLLHADFVAIVQRRRSPQCQQQHCSHPRLGAPYPACDARPVVITQDPVGPRSGWQRALIIVNQPRNCARAPGRGQQREIEWQMRTGQVLAVVSDQSIDRQIDFTDQRAVAEFVDHAPHFGDHVEHLRSICGI